MPDAPFLVSVGWCCQRAKSPAALLSTQGTDALASNELNDWTAPIEIELK
jgi:hypothetical protein